jgi:mono/diheme cytochrome c family protein
MYRYQARECPQSTAFPSSAQSHLKNLGENSRLIAIANVALIAACVGSGENRHRESGEQLFAEHCAACHGENARGDGIINSYLKVPAPDLTLIAARRDGHFPDEEIYRIIDGQSRENFTPSRHMPIWGYEFFGNDSDDEQAHGRASSRVDSIVAFLKTRQQRQPLQR